LDTNTSLIDVLLALRAPGVRQASRALPRRCAEEWKRRGTRPRRRDAVRIDPLLDIARPDPDSLAEPERSRFAAMDRARPGVIAQPRLLGQLAWTEQTLGLLEWIRVRWPCLHDGQRADCGCGSDDRPEQPYAHAA
jgi:hypothetical protein